MWTDCLRIAVHALRGHAARSLLTAASITVGAFSIVLMTSLADSGLHTLSAGMEELGGARLITLWGKALPGALRPASYCRGLVPDDLSALRSIPHVTGAVLMASLSKRGLRSDFGKQARGDVVAADGRFLAFFRYPVVRGRPLDAEDLVRHAPVCVLGAGMARRLFGGREALGHTVTTPELHCHVVGVLGPVDLWGVDFSWNWNDVLVVPLTAVLDQAPEPVQQHLQFFLRTDGVRYNDFVKRVARVTLLERHHGVDDFVLFDYERWLSGYARLFLLMKVVVGLLAGIALLVGGVGIMNMMLVAVSERVREIGVRKALGASGADIARQFLVEAVLLSGAGGASGAGLGVLGALFGCEIIRRYKPAWITAISHPAVAVTLAVTMLVGVVFGYVPARRAGRMDPVRAMRTEG